MVTIYRTMDVSTGRIYPTQGVDPSLTGGTVADNRSVEIVFQYLKGGVDITEEWVSSHYSYITFDVATDYGEPFTFHNNSSNPFNGRTFGVPSEVVRRITGTYMKFQLAFLDTGLNVDYNDPVIALSTVYSEKLDSSRLARSSIDRLLVRDSITDEGSTDGWMIEAWKDFFSNNSILTIDVGSEGGEAQRTLVIKTKTGPVRTVRLPVLTLDEAEDRGSSPIEAFLRAENGLDSSYFTTKTVRSVLRDLSGTRQGKIAHNRVLPDGRTEWEDGDISLDDADGAGPSAFRSASAEAVSALSRDFDSLRTEIRSRLDALEGDVRAALAGLSEEEAARAGGDEETRAMLDETRAMLDGQAGTLELLGGYYRDRATRNAYRPTDSVTVSLTGEEEVNITFDTPVMDVRDVRLDGMPATVCWDFVPGTGNRTIAVKGVKGLTGLLKVGAMCVVR